MQVNKYLTAPIAKYQTSFFASRDLKKKIFFVC